MRNRSYRASIAARRPGPSVIVRYALVWIPSIRELLERLGIVRDIALTIVLGGLA